MRHLLLLALVLCTACSQGANPEANAGANSAAPESVATSDRRFVVVIKDHKFNPAELDVPANTKFELLVVNEDSTPEEFESHELNREKIVTGGGMITVLIGPLKPGRYPFFGEFHMDTAQGALIAK
jgi:plastocyanin